MRVRRSRIFINARSYLKHLRSSPTNSMISTIVDSLRVNYALKESTKKLLVSIPKALMVSAMNVFQGSRMFSIVLSHAMFSGCLFPSTP